MSKKPFRDFDLPTKHLIGKKHFVPPKARDSVEIERRRELPKGVLIAEYQYKGIAMATMMLQLLHSPEDLASINQILAPSGINTSHYNFAYGLPQNSVAPVMRRRLKLARLDAPDPELRPTSFMLRQEVLEDLSVSTDKAFRLTVAAGNNPKEADLLSKQIARNVGHASLVLDCVDMGDAIGYGEIQGTDFELSALARNRGLHTLAQARKLELVLGEAPSLASLADPDSALSVHTRREATNNVRSAYEEAYETMAIAA